ncbi:MAG: family transcriptional regulator, partial [Herbinix sp.]|nr:family transcriptional regulator [Herbinix sp.]
MSIKPVPMGELLGGFADYLTPADLIAARLLAKISSTIVKKRIDLNLTQKEFAEFLGVTQGMVSKWESEDYNFTIEALANICEKLDLKLDIVMRSNIYQ